MGAIVIPCAILVAWCIMISWEDSEDRWWSLMSRGYKHVLDGAIDLRSNLRSKLPLGSGAAESGTLGQSPGEHGQSASFSHGYSLHDIESNVEA